MTKAGDLSIRGENPGEPGQVAVRPVQRGELEQAVGLLLTGRANPGATGVEAFLRYARDNHIDVNSLCVASRDGRPCAAALIVPGAGRTGMAFVSPIAHGNRIADVAAAIREAARRLDPAQVRIVQVLLDNGQELEAQALMAAGFGKLAHLIYMQKAIAATEAGRPLTIAPPLRRITWSDDRYDAFANAILASYEQTLDCPGLLGLRDIGDIIAGHQATGRFVPELWQTICEQPGPGRAELDAAGGGGPVAVMLLCDLPHRQALELVYLGVSVPYRGQGWARRLVEHAVHLARQRGCDKIMLAVDEHNTPALKLYRSMHFTATSRRTALIRQVKS